MKIFTSLAICLLSGLPAFAQEDSTTYDSVNVTVVNVDVVVTDRKGEPVTGLQLKDFVVLEDGKPVEISNFSAIGSAPAAATGALEDVATTAGADLDAEVQAPAPAHFVLLVDNSSIQIHNRAPLIKRLSGTLETLVRPGDRVLVVSLDRTAKIVTPFTDDLELVREGLASITRQTSSGSLAHMDFRRVLDSIEAADLVTMNSTMSEIRAYAGQRYSEARSSASRAQEWVSTLAGIPGRKAVVFLSDGFSSSPGEVLVEIWERKFPGRPFDRGILQEFDASRLMLEVGLYANANRVTFYPVGGERRTVSASSPERGGFGIYTAAHESREETNMRDGLKVLASHTGGVAGNGLGGLVEAMATLRRDLDSYYSLAYTPKEAGAGRDRRISVRLTDRQSGWKLRYREGYRDKTEDERLEDQLISVVRLGEGENFLGLEMRAGQATAAEGKLVDLPIDIRFPLSSVTLIPGAKSLEGKLLLLVSAEDEDGRMSPPQRIAIPVSVPRGATVEAASQYAGYSTVLRIRRGPHRIAIVVRDLVASLDSGTYLDYDPG